MKRNEIISASFKGAVSDETWSAADDYVLADTAVVYKQRDRDFVILNITDIHFSDYDIRALMAYPAMSTVRRLVAKVRPDLITVTGDMVCGSSTLYSVKRFTDMMTGFAVPWAPVMGNHDGESNCDCNYLADIMLSSPYCLLRKGPASMGVGNYIVNIAERDGGGVNAVHSLIMMDTHRSQVRGEQIEWYRWAAKGICAAMGRTVESSVFAHIPLAEYQYAFDEAWDGENSRWRPGFGAWGEKHEQICCPRGEDGQPVNNGFFAAIREAGTTKNYICGHEHINDFSIVYQGVRLTYTLKVGMGSGFRRGMNGCTKITVSGSGLSLEHLFSV